MKSIVWQQVLSLVLGFCGGMVAMQLENRRAVYDMSGKTVRASRFELASSSGNILAFWGQDAQHQRIVIAFLDEKGKLRAELGNEPSRLEDGRATAFVPFMAMLGSDGKVRLREGLNVQQYPFLAMGDQQTETRVLLGHSLHGSDMGGASDDPWDNWSLLFKDPSQGWRDYVDIGVTTPLGTDRRTGYVLLRNSADRQLSQMPGTQPLMSGQK
jgi:hypothetical protein